MCVWVVGGGVRVCLWVCGCGCKCGGVCAFVLFVCSLFGDGGLEEKYVSQGTKMKTFC